MYRWTVLYAALLVIAFAALSCSGGGGSPVSPTTPSELTGAANQTGQSQTQLWGYYDCYIDLENMTVEAVDNRSAMFAANVVQFVNGNPANLGFNIKSTPTGTGYIDVDIDVSITHPFPGMSMYNGYDVRGIFIGDGSGSLKYNADLDYGVPGTDQAVLGKPEGTTGYPDGYTRWFNRKEFTTPGIMGYTPGIFASKNFAGTATLCPYKYFADGLTATKDAYEFLTATSNHGVFSAGKTNTRNYYLRFPNAKGVVYGYAIVANWIDETTHPANAPEAVACDMAITPSIYYESSSSNGGHLKLDFGLFSWLQMPDKIFIESNMLAAVHELDATEMTPTGGGTTYSTYHVDIPVDEVEGIEGNEFFVIAEYSTFDYKNTFGITNSAGSDKMAACFRYDVFTADEPYCNDVTATNCSLTNVNAGPYTAATITGTGFKGLSGTATTAIVKFTGAHGMVNATNVVVTSDTLLTFNVDFSAWTEDDTLDVYAENECGSSATLMDFVDLTPCPSQIYYTSFDASEGEATNWSKSAGVYWACLWFQTEICDSTAACNLYGDQHWYAWRTNGFPIPSCWTGTIELTITHNCTKQEYYYDLSRVEYSTYSAAGPWLALPFPTHPYGSQGYWEYSWANETITTNLTPLVTPGNTIWIRFDSYSLDYIGNSASGWHITEMKIE